MRIVKLIGIIVLGTGLQASAGVFSQNISFSGRNVTLEKVFSIIHKQSGYFVFCDYSLIKEARRVNLDVRDASIQEVMTACLKDQPLSYEIVDKTIIIEPKKTAETQQVASLPPPVKIKGKITTDTGDPIPGVSIMIKGSNKGTVTNDNGEFELEGIDAGTTLVISSVGYERVEYKVSGRTSFTIRLKSKSATVNEIVVTALGISKEASKVGYSVSTVSGDQMTKARETNVALSLAGQVAGLNVHGANGGPASSARILLRGMPSMNSGGSPLFVINGVPIDNSQRGAAGEWGGSDNGDGISNVNPDDVESMTVLKGQAASALYGARASNGVILITTKKGRKGEATVEYNVNSVWDKAINNTDYQYEYGQGLEGAKPTTATGAQNSNRFSWGAKMDGSSITQYNGKTYAYSPFKNNLKDFYRTGPTLTNSLSVSGGSDKVTYRVSLSNMDNAGIVRNSGVNRKTVNLNLDGKVSDKLSVSLMANYIDQQDRNRPNLSDGPGNPNNFQFLAANVDERIFEPGYDSRGYEVVFSDDNYVTNPWFVVSKWINDVGRRRLISAVSAKYSFTSWLYLMGRIGYDLENDRYFTVTPTGTNYSFNSAGQSGQFNNLNTATIYELNEDALLGVNHKIVDGLNFDATLGANFRTNQGEQVGISGSQFVIPFLYTPSNVVSFGRSYEFAKKEVHSGFYSLDFSYKDFLSLGTTGRYDAYSTLPSNNRTIFTPSVSGSFLFSSLLHSKTLSYGKLRASYAQTSGEPFGGNFNYGAYQTSIYYSVGNGINGVSTGNFSSTLPNLLLKPFTKTETEIGTELKFLNNRLGADLAYYHQVTHHEIMNATVSNATGYSSSVVGSGSIQNDGVEVLLTARPFETNDFAWNITVNYTHVMNKILHTDELNNNVTQGTYRPLNATTAFVVGKAGPQVMAYDYSRDAKGNIIVDGSGLPVSNGKQIPFGSVLPTDYGGVRNNFTYKSWSLDFLVDYNYGNKILSATQYYTIYRGLNKMTLAGRETGITTGVTSGGSSNTVTATAQDYYQRLASISRVDVLNGDFIKLRQVTVGYTLSRKVLGNIPLFSQIQLSLVGRNLWTIMKHSDNIDPESNFATSVRYAGIEGTSLPATRTFGFNINCRFK
ncbi:SusC/RagA family TonB-linked outer membrane protein [Dinghuibacter silviterrae]|nr:SusC/RagA family TonB-linked outer membrane protein [Dinghuibacter silviterrae]